MLWLDGRVTVVDVAPGQRVAELCAAAAAAAALPDALLRALLEVLGIVHRPDRFDFGWRYVETQLPEDERKRLARFAFIADPEVLRARAPDLAAELLQRLRRDAP